MRSFEECADARNTDEKTLEAICRIAGISIWDFSTIDALVREAPGKSFDGLEAVEEAEELAIYILDAYKKADELWANGYTEGLPARQAKRKILESIGPDVDPRDLIWGDDYYAI